MTILRNPPPNKRKKSDEETQRQLQKDFTITPKTARLLVQLGYHSYRDLRSVSPNHIAAQLRTLPPAMSKAQIDAYRRAFRRMVWLATQEKPEEHAKVCSDWSNRGLVARGIWKDGYDDLTGDQVNELLLETGAS